MYKKLKRKINDKLKKTAKFYRVDLHVHSHESYDFPKKGDKKGCIKCLTKKDENAKAEYFIESASDPQKNLSIIAITDHNKSRVAEKISRLSTNKLIILPGMEADIQASEFDNKTIHLLTIFPQGTSSNDIDKVFPGDSGMDLYDKRDKDSKANIHIKNFINTTHSLSGICIASHVNSESGTRDYFFAQNIKRLIIRKKIEILQEKERKQLITQEEQKELERLKRRKIDHDNKIQNQYLSFLSKYEFDAVEIAKPEEREFYRSIHMHELGIRPITCIISSDAHNLEDIGLKGYSTYIKMTKVGMEDLKKALKDPEVRIKYEGDTIVQKVRKIKGISFNAGFFKDEIFGFSENLSCIIGGRGSGKSSLIDAIRYVFKKRIEHLDEVKKKDIRDRQEKTLKDTEIKLLFEDDNSDELVLKTNYQSDNTIEVRTYSLNGNSRSEDPFSSPKLQIELYGWGEIEILARNTKEQRELIDRFIVGIEGLKSNETQQIRILGKNTNEIIEYAKEINDLLTEIVTLDEKEKELQELDTKEMKEIYKEFDLNEKKKRILKKIKNEIVEVKGKFVDEDDEKYNLQEVFAEIIAEAINEKENEPEQLPILKSYHLTKIVEEIVEYYDLLIKKFDVFLSLIVKEQDKVEKEKSAILEELNKIVEGLTEEEFKRKVNARESLANQVFNMKESKKKIVEYQNKIGELFKKRWEEIIPYSMQIKEKIYKKRNKKVKEISNKLNTLKGDTKVTISIEKLLDRTEFEKKLGSKKYGTQNVGILKGIPMHYLEKNYANLISEKFLPTDFVKIIINKKLKKLKIIGSNVENIIDEEKARGIISHLSPFLNGNYYYDPDKLKKLLELEYIIIDDLPRIYLGGTPIENLSPGQRCNALIPIILLEGRNPIIIDQPEDNLDNKLVFDLVVDVLRSLKEKRQIIVATHNPNIPVSGDAEQIIVLDAPSEVKGKVVAQGSIDCTQIIEQVKEVMEGSEEAFKIRAQKYGFKLTKQ
jgi:ABC-type lipoprotein export system ATPase subunit